MDSLLDLPQAHGQAMTEFDHGVHAVGQDQWDLPTPCTRWTVRNLVNHLVYEQLWAPLLLGGATIEEVGDRFEGDVLGHDPVAAWTAASGAARRAWTEPGAVDRRVHVSWGVIDAIEYGWQMTVDLAVHGWDLTAGIGKPVVLSDELARTLLHQVEPVAESWQDSGAFGRPVPVSEDADPQTRLLGLLGRDATAWS
ncbi:MAG TPA: TIGR03086 family metal-binding protein [Pseudonocardiaceae bacterium]